MATLKKKGGLTSEPELYFIGKQFPGEATYGDTPGDAGVIVQLIDGPNTEKLIRLYALTKFKGEKSFQCGKCGSRFVSEYYREAHGKRRHRAGGPRYKDFSDLTAEQRQQVVAEAGRPGLSRKDPDYFVSPQEFNVPDPSDREMASQERELASSIEWDKTAASRQ